MCVAFNPPYIKRMPRIWCHTVFALRPLCLFVTSACARSSGRLIHSVMPSRLYLCFSSGFGRVFIIAFWCKVSFFFLSLFVLWGNHFCRLQYIMTIRKESVWGYPYHPSVSLTILITFLFLFQFAQCLVGPAFSLEFMNCRAASLLLCIPFHVKEYFIFTSCQQWRIRPIFSACGKVCFGFAVPRNFAAP